MTCKTIMLSNPQTLVPDDTVPKAIELMLQYGMRNLPVVDGEGRFLGLFTAFNLIKLLLPKAATMEGGLTDLSFVQDSLSEIGDRLREVQAHHVGDNIDTENLPVVHPDTSLMEAMLLLYQHRTHVTVVELATNKVVGVVTTSEVLEAIGRAK